MQLEATIYSSVIRNNARKKTKKGERQKKKKIKPK